MSIIADLSQLVSDAFQELGLDRGFGAVATSRRPDLAHFQCNGAMAAAKQARRAPRQIAEEVVAILRAHPEFDVVEVAGPGFINIKLTEPALAARADEMRLDERLGCERSAAPERVVIDFGGPNVAKAMHVGHLRSSVVGDCLQRLFRFVGDEVVSDIHMGDWGLPMGMLIVELERRRPDLPYFDAELSGPYPEEPPVSVDDLAEMYPKAAALAKEDETEREKARLATAQLQEGRPGYRALWQHFMNESMKAMKADFGALGVHFDWWLGEAAVNDAIAPLLASLEAKGALELSQGAQVITVVEEGDNKEMPPLIVVKSDGGVTYGTTDLATIVDRVARVDPHHILYVVDKRQHLHFEQVFRAARRCELSGRAQLEHIAFGTVNGADGKPFKTREGGVMKLGDLIARATEQANLRLEEGALAKDVDQEIHDEIARKVGLAALKFADLANDRESDYVFNLEKFTRFEGKTGPYLLYATVRIKSIFRKAAERGFEAGTVSGPLSDAERKLILVNFLISSAVQRAHAERRPHLLCDFAYDLAQAFSRFYNNCPILAEEDPAIRASRLALAGLTLAQFELVLGILGIETPERM